MIATVSLNPSIDVRYSLPVFQIGQIHRAASIDKTAGGKGLNVSRVLSQLGMKVSCTGFLGGKNGEWIADRLQDSMLENRFIPIKGETRSCLAILTEDGQTEILEQGPYISEDERKLFLEIYDSILEEADYIVASGSLPTGLEQSFYQLLADRAKQKGRYFLLDTSGIGLAQGIQGKPFLIKPNKEEFCKLIGKSHIELDEMMEYAQEICKNGVEYLLLSMGKEGALLVSKSRILKADIPVIKAMNPVGSGDSMLAGFTFAHSKEYSLEEVLKWACACGMSNAASEKTGSINPLEVQQFINLIKVVEITNL
ncbi:1-phosphofructokinase [Neobacillus cucumis]|uniref:Tagatose-6-phosphate kinase n=1 Tax=Neobacillus cucumis TaxID=1740721 RepID=A0A2N5HIJ6_9BACI|nr:1-phosphofructokinase [Neobacillus cucumis]PLS05346.1 1-phosphofructokinase [Neobacillus cucumis]